VRWQQRYAVLVVSSDIVIILVTMSIAALVRLTGRPAIDEPQLASGALAALAMAVALLTVRAWNARTLGAGAEEFKRLGRATVGSAVVLGLGGLAVMADSVRPWVYGIIPLTGALCAVGRYALRKWLHHERAHGRCALSVLAVGDTEYVADLVRRTRRDPFVGWRIDAACTPTGMGTDGSEAIEGVLVLGDLDATHEVARSAPFRVVTVSPAAGWSATRLHQLAWDLECTNADLAVDPGLMEIAGPRMHITPVDGLPLLRLSRPRFTGPGHLMKNVIDRCAALFLLLVTAPVFLATAIAIRWCDGGPVFFRQDRVGANGRTFQMIKFRSMQVDAEAVRGALDSANEGAGPMFKLRNDPRVTPVGAFLRRYSMDELPQLINVLTGTMSLVGPRPPLPAEVSTYAADAQRRLLVRPGMTGLWQVSGRSSLSWEESVRLDLRYVENWSIALDATILWKTVGAVIGSRGAY
jgi:exopolysaccharide biosynthesis polyprenyl glycosylphosphotransferase